MPEMSSVGVAGEVTCCVDASSLPEAAASESSCSDDVIGRPTSGRQPEEETTAEQPTQAGHMTGHMTLRNKHWRLPGCSTDYSMDCLGAPGAKAARRERTKDACRPLRHWLYSHRDQPYPSRADKLHLAAVTQLSVTQVSNWFANARRRLKNTVDRAVRPRGGRDDWARRIRLYNRHTVGNQERLSISSDDSDDRDLDDDLDNDLDGQADVRTVVVGDDEDSFQSDSTAHTPLSSESIAHRLFGDCSPHPAHFDIASQRSAVVGRQSLWSSVASDQLGFRHSGSSGAVGTGVPVSPGVPQGPIVGPNVGPGDVRFAMSRDAARSRQDRLSTASDGSGLDPEDLSRRRNASGSLSSHDFEDIRSTASSSSVRSSPVHDQHPHPGRQLQQQHGAGDVVGVARQSSSAAKLAELSELAAPRQLCNTHQHAGVVVSDYDLLCDYEHSGTHELMHWKEISAALALTTLARAHSHQRHYVVDRT